MTKLTAAAGLVLALTTATASAADLPSYKGPPPPPPPPVFSWTGVYGGINIGYGFGAGDREYGYEQFHAVRTDLTSLLGVPVGPFPTGTFHQPGGPSWNGTTDINGVVGGGQAGANFQFNRWLVVGVEADIQATGLSSNSRRVGAGNSCLLSGFNFVGGAPGGCLGVLPVPPGFGNANGVPYLGIANSIQHVDWYGSLRARAGITPFSPNLLLFATAGLAYGSVSHSFNYGSLFTPTAVGPAAGFNTTSTAGLAFGNNTVTDLQFGWTAGAGVEWAPLSYPNWSVKLEYLYTDLGKTTLSTLGTSAAQARSNLFLGAAPVAGFTHTPYNASSNTAYTRWHTVRVGVNYHFHFGAAPVVASY